MEFVSHVRDTSKSAFVENIGNGIMIAQIEKVYNFMKDAKQELTRREIAYYLRMETSTVSARINELIKIKKLRVTGKRFCTRSKRLVEVVGMADMCD